MIHSVINIDNVLSLNRRQSRISTYQTWARYPRSMCPRTCPTCRASQTTCPTVQTSGLALPRQDLHTTSLSCPLSLRRAIYLVHTHTLSTILLWFMLFNLWADFSSFQVLSSNLMFHLLHRLLLPLLSPPSPPPPPQELPLLRLLHLLLLLTAPLKSLERQVQVCHHATQNSCTHNTYL